MASTTKPPSQPLTSQLASRFKTARVFKAAVEQATPPPQGAPNPKTQAYNPRQITSVSFDDAGEQLITAAEDESFRVYNCKSGKYSKTLYSKKYGVDLPRFTHKNTNIVYASTKEDDTIRYHSLHDNKYLRYYKGHKKKVISLEVSPIDDGFMSGSEDHTVRLWDLRSAKARGELNLPATPIIAYDTNGVVFAVGLNVYHRINLYDTKNFDKEPFLHIELVDLALTKISFPARQPMMTSLSFSSNGRMLLVGTAGDYHYVLDAFEGHLLWRLEGFVGLERGKSGSHIGMVPSRGISGEEVCWTPDSKFVISGSQDGKVYFWDLSNSDALPKPTPPGSDPATLKPTFVLDGHPSATRCVRFNPRYLMMATAGSELAFWQPDMGEGDAAKVDKGKGPEVY